MATIAQIDKKIGTFITNRDKLKTLGHEVAMMIFDHALAHGDCTRAIKLAAALPNSWQPQMEAWFKAFSPIRVILKNTKCELAVEYKKAEKANRPDFWNRQAAMETPFYDLIDEPKAQEPIDLVKISKLLEMLANKLEKGADDATKVDPKEALTAKAIAAQLRAIKVVHVAPANDVKEVEAPKLLAVG